MEEVAAARPPRRHAVDHLARVVADLARVLREEAARRRRGAAVPRAAVDAEVVRAVPNANAAYAKEQLDADDAKDGAAAAAGGGGGGEEGGKKKKVPARKKPKKPKQPAAEDEDD